MSSDEDPFELIEKGNAFEAASNYWRSAEYFSRSSISLRRCANDRAAQIIIRNRGGDGPPHRSEELEQQQRIVTLFRTQSLEYMYKARHSLIEALIFENNQDRDRTREVVKSGIGSLDPLCSLISLEDREIRNTVFKALFLGTIKSLNVATQTESISIEIDDASDPINNSLVQNRTKPSPNETTDDNQQQSIETRLKKLNTSLLPNNSHFEPYSQSFSRNNIINSDKRVNEIRCGLKRLGISMPDSIRESYSEHEYVSTEDQVKIIINQATDAIRVEKGLHLNNGDDSAAVNTYSDCVDIDDNDSIIDYVEDKESNIGALLATAEKLAAKSGIDSVGNGIEKALAFLLEARLCLEIQNMNANDSDYGNKQTKDANAQNEACSSSIVEKSAVGLIKNAQHCLQEVLQQWGDMDRKTS